MNIKSAKENPKFEGQDVNVVTATIDGVEMHIPKDTGNRHWVAIQAWVAEGNTIAEAD